MECWKYFEGFEYYIKHKFVSVDRILDLNWRRKCERVVDQIDRLVEECVRE